MLASIKRCAKEDRLSLKAISANKKWDLDGKSLRQILSDIGAGWGYAYGVGMSSHWIHGDWFDLRNHHLQKVNGRYHPKWEHGTPDPRGICPATILCLSCLSRFIKWNRSDPDRVVLPMIHKLLEITTHIDEAHEASF
jgi:hypothetical protein